MKNTALTSRESMLANVAEVVRLKLNHTETSTQMEKEVTAIQKYYADELDRLTKKISDMEAAVLEYCARHRAELFPEKKSLDITCAVVGFESLPPRVETASRRIKWSDVVARCLASALTAVYVRHPEPVPNKKAMLDDREKMSAELKAAMGIEFVTDEEQFFIRPKSTVATASTQEVES